MNETSIEWCTHSWNPLTGCFHPCRHEYCYLVKKSTSVLNRLGARYRDAAGNLEYEKNWRSRQTDELHLAAPGEVFPNGFDPTFYAHRLDEPLKFKSSEPTFIFVANTGDLFGSWVPAAWINQVLDVTERSDHLFLFLSKNPARMRSFMFSDASWCGTTITSDADYYKVDLLRGVFAPVHFLSIEPLHGPVVITDFSNIDWIIIGAESGCGARKYRPEKEWVNTILSKAATQKIAVFMKESIRPYADTFVQEYPPMERLKESIMRNRRRMKKLATQINKLSEGTRDPGERRLITETFLRKIGFIPEMGERKAFWLHTVRS